MLGHRGPQGYVVRTSGTSWGRHRELGDIVRALETSGDIVRTGETQWGHQGMLGTQGSLGDLVRTGETPWGHCKDTTGTLETQRDTRGHLGTPQGHCEDIGRPNRDTMRTTQHSWGLGVLETPRNILKGLGGPMGTWGDRSVPT